MSKRKRSRSTPATFGQFADNSLSAYRSSMQWYEMMTASAVTIALRLSAIGESLKNNEMPDGVEMGRMVSEKNDAMLQGGAALADWQSSLMKFYSTLWPRMPNPAAATSINSSVASDWLASSTRLATLTLKGYSQLLKPFHSASTANAYRLSGTNKKPRS